MAGEALAGRRIVVGVTGGIAAYKACDLVSTLTKVGAGVRVVMTEAATRFVSPLTFATLSGNPVAHDPWTERAEIEHISLADFADVVIVAPATANIIGKCAGGIADDLLSTVLLTVDCPLVIAPAMNTRMLAADAVQANLGTLRERGVTVIEPEEGRLACGEVGAGRLPATEVLLQALEEVLGAHGPLAGVRVLVTAGPTREALDPVRFISNPSSGRMGYALADEAARRGADVTLVSGPVSLEAPRGVEVVDVFSAQEMHEAVQGREGGVDVFVGAAAVADWRPADPSGEKVKKSGRDEMTVRLERTPDVIEAVGAWEPRPVVVGFAAETEDVRENAVRKLQEKELDLIVANDVSAPGAGFGSTTNRVTLIDVIGRETDLPLMSKADVAAAILDWAGRLMVSRESQ